MSWYCKYRTGGSGSVKPERGSQARARAARRVLGHHEAHSRCVAPTGPSVFAFNAIEIETCTPGMSPIQWRVWAFELAAARGHSIMRLQRMRELHSSATLVVGHQCVQLCANSFRSLCPEQIWIAQARRCVTCTVSHLVVDSRRSGDQQSRQSRLDSNSASCVQYLPGCPASSAQRCVASLRPAA